MSNTGTSWKDERQRQNSFDLIRYDAVHEKAEHRMDTYVDPIAIFLSTPEQRP